MDKFTFIEEPVVAPVPDHVGLVGSTNLYEVPVYEPVLIDKEDADGNPVFVDQITHKETLEPRYVVYDSEDETKTVDSGPNKRAQVQANYPGTDIPAFVRGGGSFYATKCDADGNEIRRKEILVSALPLEDQADLLRIAGNVRAKAASDWGVKERPE